MSLCVTCACPCVPTAGSYVALTVQGRPPGSPQIPLADSEVDLAALGHMSPIMASPHSPGTSGNAERITSPVLMGVSFEALFPKGEMQSSFILIFFPALQIVNGIFVTYLFIDEIHLWKSYLFIHL